MIDATVGNGHDTLFLAQLLAGHGQLIGYDIQPAALEQTQKRLETLSPLERGVVILKLASHAHFEAHDVKLIVYNLGYLPGGDKALTTQTNTTLLSLQNGLSILSQDGAISITCYPGHPEGAKEQEALIAFLQELPSNEWTVCHHVWINRPLSPTWILLQRAFRS